MRNRHHAAALATAGLIALALALTGLFWVRVTDSSTLLQLRTGRVMVETGNLPLKDIFSSNALGRAWIIEGWIGNAALYLIYKSTAWWGLFSVRMVLVAGTLTTLLVLCRRHATQSWACLTAFLLAVGNIALVPDFFLSSISWLSFALLMLLLDRASTGPRLVMLVVPLFVFWANFSSSVMAGLLLLVLTVAAHLLRGPGPGGISRPHVGWFIIVAVLALIASLLNPFGYQLFCNPPNPGDIAPVHAVSFWMPPAVNRSFLPFWIYTVIAVGICAFGNRALRAVDWTVLAGLLLAALFHRAYIPFFSLAAIPPLARAVHQLSADSANRAWAMLLVSMLMPVLSMWTYYPEGRVVGTGLARGHFPEDAAARLATMPMDGAVLNHAADGGYLVWRLWPGWLVTMDHRPMVYGPGLIERHRQVWNGRRGWDSALEEWNVQAILGRYGHKGDPSEITLYREIARSNDWELFHWDNSSVLYVRKGRISGTSEGKPYRRLHPLLPWRELVSLQENLQQWEALGADLRRSALEYPENSRAADFVRRWKENQDRPKETFP